MNMSSKLFMGKKLKKIKVNIFHHNHFCPYNVVWERNMYCIEDSVGKFKYFNSGNVYTIRYLECKHKGFKYEGISSRERRSVFDDGIVSLGYDTHDYVESHFISMRGYRKLKLQKINEGRRESILL